MSNVSLNLPQTTVSWESWFKTHESGQWQLAEFPSKEALQVAYGGHDNLEHGSPFGPEMIMVCLIF